MLPFLFLSLVLVMWGIVPALVKPRRTHYREDGPVTINPEYRGVIHIKSRP